MKGLLVREWLSHHDSDPLQFETVLSHQGCEARVGIVTLTVPSAVGMEFEKAVAFEVDSRIKAGQRPVRLCALGFCETMAHGAQREDFVATSPFGSGAPPGSG
jgi:hypothetical protein